MFEILKVNLGSKVKPLKFMKLIRKLHFANSVHYHSYSLLDYQSLILKLYSPRWQPHVNYEHWKCDWSKLRCKYKIHGISNTW